MIIEKAAGAVVYRQKDKEREYLLVQTLKNHDWRFPKGDLEGEESPEEAAEREVFEKVGLQPKFDFSFHQTETYLIGEDRWKQEIIYPAEYIGPQEIKLDETKVKQYIWVTYEKGENLLQYPEVKNILREINNYLGVLR